jgi:hypothetical protein
MPASAWKKLLNGVLLGLFGTDMEALVTHTAGDFPGQTNVTGENASQVLLASDRLGFACVEDRCVFSIRGSPT